MIIVRRWVWTIGACIVYYNHAWEKRENGRDAFHVRTGSHSWAVMMHQHNSKTISVNNCTLQVRLLLNLGCSKKWSEQASNNMFSSIHAVETFESITGTDNRSTLAQNMGFAISETSSSCGTCLEYESTSNVSRYCFKREKKGKDLRKLLPRPTGKHVVVQPDDDVFGMHAWRVCLLVPFSIWRSRTF